MKKYVSFLKEKQTLVTHNNQKKKATQNNFAIFCNDNFRKSGKAVSQPAIGVVRHGNIQCLSFLKEKKSVAIRFSLYIYINHLCMVSKDTKRKKQVFGAWRQCQFQTPLNMYSGSIFYGRKSKWRPKKHYAQRDECNPLFPLLSYVRADAHLMSEVPHPIVESIPQIIMFVCVLDQT